MRAVQAPLQYSLGFLHVGPEAISHLPAKATNRTNQEWSVFHVWFLPVVVLFYVFAEFSRFPIQDEGR